MKKRNFDFSVNRFQLSVLFSCVCGLSLKRKRNEFAVFNISEIQEVLQEFFAFGRQNRFRVKLDALDFTGFMAQTHNQTVGRGGGNFQTIG